MNIKQKFVTLRSMRAFFNSPYRSYFFIFLFFLLSLALFEKGKEEKEEEFKHLENKYLSLLKKEEMLLLEQKRLLNEKGSHLDPSYQEFLIIEKLGMIPEGYKKVLFYKEDPQ